MIVQGYTLKVFKSTFIQHIGEYDAFGGSFNTIGFNSTWQRNMLSCLKLVFSHKKQTKLFVANKSLSIVDNAR